MATQTSVAVRYFYAHPLKAWWAVNRAVDIDDPKYVYAIHPPPYLTPNRKFTNVTASTTDVVVLSREQ